ncbi:Lrp/AsnC family transcriptional regulator [Candidatus Cardinium hertigii]|uniref:Leucine-responsive regulatory protein n=1 Tax=Candidatus Cardinium hertigii TaxID=247481 RepID=A0A2Z3LAU9_9BACT|nr:Lrp/AsnC family transcriptional regulator [Candidatus Cardinium hertigii]AWN81392.1 Leucine-responsive regulatory protein [Candidatus Cardinium hertigii]
MERVKTLEQYKVITHYYAQIDYAQLGLDTTVMVGITLQKMTGTAVKLFQAAINKIAAITTCYQVIGIFDFIVMVQTKDMLTYQNEVVAKLYMLEEVARMQTLTVTQLLKNKPLRLA